MVWASGVIVVVCFAALSMGSPEYYNDNATDVVLTIYDRHGSNIPPLCMLSTGITVFSQRPQCGKCTPTYWPATNNILWDECENGTLGSIRYGCGPQCENCTNTVDLVLGECTNIEVTEPDFPGLSFKVTADVPEEVYCEPTAETFYTRQWEPYIDDLNCSVALLPENTIVSTKQFDKLSEECIPDPYGKYYQVTRKKVDDYVVYNGALGCNENECLDCDIGVTDWSANSCQPETDNGNPITVLLGECFPDPNPNPNPNPNGDNDKNTIPMELLAVGILVLVLAGFFLAQACHRATKAKFGTNRSLNDDGEGSDALISSALARDTSGRVAYGSTGIVRTEAALKASNTNEVPPIVATEQVAAAVHAEKQQRENKAMKL